ncbi:zinc finger protein 267 [Amyelois transitella]|uniref:zinc finger protein 267 n=1 Tax=Amyelois transitella TaxID=680683 RepID=UPI00298F44BB|nr:zinc finger protein 267 [Amyelois transitella]
MVGSLALLKILHCKNVCQKSTQQQKEKNHRVSSDESYRKFKEKKKQSKSRNERYKIAKKKNQRMSYDESFPELDRSEIHTNQQKTCRVCLKEGDVPIYGENSQEDLSEALNIFGGIAVLKEDPYPKFLCNSCNSLLQGAIILRKTAQQSDEYLKMPVKKQCIITEEEDPSYLADDHLSFDEMDKQQEDAIFHCNKCDLDFPTIKEYTDHMLSQEHENMRHKCPICNKTYASLYLKTHLRLHKREAPYMCDICGKKFIMQGQFTRHRLTHFYNLPFKCPLCPYRGRFTESLKMHMRSHTGEKPYQCSQCAHRFVNKSNLNKHLLTHKGEHDFVCASCGRGFYTKRDLELHLKVDHAGIKDHLCNICGKAFGYRKQMMKHQLKVHKREKLRSGRTPLYLLVDSNKQNGASAPTET